MVMNPKELSHLIHRVFRTVVNPEIRISEYPIPLGENWARDNRTIGRIWLFQRAMKQKCDGFHGRVAINEKWPRSCVWYLAVLARRFDISARC